MLFVKDIMTQNLKTIDGSSTIFEAALLMTKSKIGSVVVTNRSNPTSIVTDGDISRAIAKGLDPKKTSLKSIMHKPLITATREMRVEEAAKLMATSNIKKLPVVEEGKLIGMVTQTDIVGSTFDLVTSLKEMVRARYRPPDFQP